MDELAAVEGRRRGRLQVRVGHRAPLPRRVLAPLGQRRRSPATWRTSTERIHLGSGIFNPLPQVNHPAKVAERVAMLDHLSNGRFEFGTGRGAGSHEILGFLPGMEDLSGTREIWEDVDRRVPQDVDAGHLRGLRRQVLVAAAAQDPAQAVREAAPADVVRRRQHVELGDGRAQGPRRARLLGRRRSTRCRRSRKAYKDAIATAEPIGAFVNDNLMVCIGAYVAEDGQKARESLGQRAAELPGQQRVPLPRHVPAPGRDPELAGADPRRRRSTTSRCVDRGRRRHRRPRRGARAVPALGGDRRRPARRSASGPRRSRRRSR